MTLSKLILPTQQFRGRVEEWHRNVTASTASCACEELGLPIEECICSKVCVGTPPPLGSFADSEGPLHEVSTYGSGSSSIAPTEHSTSVYDTEFSEIMNDPDRDFESSLGEDRSSNLDSCTETTDGESAHDSLNENSASGTDSEEDDLGETLVEQRSECSLHSGITAELEDCLAADLEAAAAALEAASGASDPEPTPPQSLPNLRRDSPSPKAGSRRTSDSGNISEGGNSEDERPRKQRRLT